MENTQLYKLAIEAIRKVADDISVNKETTIENLNTLKMEIDDMIESLEHREEGGN